MTSLVSLFEQLSSTTSRKEKEAILASNKDQLFYQVLLAALDPYRTYGFQNIQVEGRVLAHTVEQERENWFVFCEILRDLAARVYTGNDAKELVTGYFVGLTDLEAKWFKRVLLKNLRCGVEAKTVNKVVPGMIPQFNIMRGEMMEFDKKGLPEVTFPVWADYKIDGLRCVAIKDGEVVTLFSRGGHIIPTLPSIEAEIATLRGSFVLDGEAMDSSWNNSLTTIRSTKNKVSDENVQYNVFDCIKLDDWKKQQCEEPYCDRRLSLTELLNSAPHLKKVVQIPGLHVNNPFDLFKFYEKALADGYEGVMVKVLTAPYQFKKCKSILKMKPYVTEEGEIVGWVYGDANGKRAGKFGGFLVKFEQGKEPTAVGGGFDDSMLDEINNNLVKDPKCYNGMVATVKGKGFTDDGFMREPVFLRFRSEEDV